MNKLKAIYLPFLMLLFSSCCLPSSIHPLSPPGEGNYDKQLEGTWYHIEENGSVGYLHIGKAKENFTKAILTQIEQSGSLGFSVLIMFPSVIGENIFLNIKVKQVDEEISSEDSGYFLAKYEVKGNDILSVSMMGMDGFPKGIQAGKVKGEITYREPVFREGSEKKPKKQERKVIDCLQITDESENIVKFIKNSNTSELFTTEVKLKRLKVD